MKLPALRDYVPSTPAARVFALTSLISSVGTGLFLAGSAVFFVRAVGLTAGEVGVALTAAAVVGLVATVPVGSLADRWSAPRVLAALQTWRIAWLVVLAFTEGPVLFTVVAAALAVADGATPPVIQAVVGSVSGPGDRPRTMAIIQTVRNLGFATGALLAAPLLAADSTWYFRAIMLGYAALIVPSVLLLLRLRLPEAAREADAARAERASRSGPFTTLRGFHDWRYALLTAVNGVLCLHMTLLSVGLPLWVVEATGAPAGIVPFMVFANTVLVVLLQVPFARGVARPHGASRALRLSGLALAGCCLLLAAAAAPSLPPVAAAGLLLTGCALLTAGELWQSIGGWELSHVHAPEDQRGLYLSVFGLSMSGQRIAGPALVTGVVMAVGAWGWAGLAALFVLATAVVGPLVRALERQGTTAEPQPDGPHGTGEPHDPNEPHEPNEPHDPHEPNERSHA